MKCDQILAKILKKNSIKTSGEAEMKAELERLN
jgi:hypothetical protein